MAQTTPPTITAAPSPAPDRSARSTFSGRVDAFVTWISAAVAQFAAVATNVYNNAVDAYNSAVAAASSVTSAATQAGLAASSASAAMATANAALWVSGATITQYANVISPANARTYRRKTATGSGTTDPSADATNYEPISTVPYALTYIGTVTPTASANVDFLTAFSSTYDNYLIYIEGVLPSADDILYMRFANAGVVDTGANYGSSAFFTLSADVEATGAGTGVNVRISVVNANDTTYIKSILGSSSYLRSTAAYESRQIQESYKRAMAVSGFRLYWQSGSNFVATGKIRVYGYTNS